MRIIKFRGKRVDNGEWIFGSLLIPTILLRGIYICENTSYANLYPDLDGKDTVTKDDIDAAMLSGISVGHFIEVIPETVGQFTGLMDRNGKEIYEFDICICPRNGANCDTPLVVKYGGQCQFYIQEIGTEKIFNMPFYSMNIEIIGTLHDNPELLNQ